MVIILGFYTLMCGDGTNDVGALKHAHVGVSIVSNAPSRTKKLKEEKTDGNGALQPATAVPAKSAKPPVPTPAERQAMTPRERAILRHRESMNQTKDLLHKVSHKCRFICLYMF